MSDGWDLGFAIGAPALTLVAGLVAIGALAWGYRRFWPPQPPTVRRLLVGLRATTLVAILLLLLGPMLRMTSSAFEPPHVVLFVDTSRSMAFVDGAQPRWHAVDAFLNGRTLERLAAGASLSTVAFADSAWLVDPEARMALRPVGAATDLANALSRAEQLATEAPLTACVLVSDGANNLGVDPRGASDELGVPIHALAVGSAGEHKDLAVVGLRARRLVHVGRLDSVAVTVRSMGLKGERALLSLQDPAGASLASADLRLVEGGREQVVHLPYRLGASGRQRLRVHAQLPSGDVAPGNDHLDLIVTALETRRRVLVLAGSPSPDLAALRRSLGRDLDLETTVIVARDGSLSGDLPGKLAGSDVIVTVDLPAAALGEDGARLVSAAVVERGAGFFAVGGPSTLGAGGWRGTPLAALVPAPIHTGDRAFREGEYTVAIEAGAWIHPLMSRTMARGPRRGWQSLPPLLGVSGLGQPSDAALVLARLAEPPGMPVIVAGRAGRGKTLVFTGATLWRWDLMLWGGSGVNGVFDPMVQGAVDWLGTREDESPLRAAPERELYRWGETVVLTAEVYDQLYEPRDDATVTVRLEGDGVSRSAVLAPVGGGRYETRLRGLRPGSYTAAVRARTPEGKDFETATDCVISERDLEASEVGPRHDLLRDIAARSGGSFSPIEAADSLGALLALEPIERTHRRVWSLGHAGWAFVLVALALSSEWAVRRWRGML